MADITDNVKPDGTLVHRKRGRPPKYDWDKYSDGQPWVLYRGTDFDTSVVSFRALVHSAARSRGLKAETAIDPRNESVSFRFFEE